MACNQSAGWSFEEFIYNSEESFKFCHVSSISEESLVASCQDVVIKVPYFCEQSLWWACIGQIWSTYIPPPFCFCFQVSELYHIFPYGSVEVGALPNLDLSSFFVSRLSSALYGSLLSFSLRLIGHGNYGPAHASVLVFVSVLDKRYYPLVISHALYFMHIFWQIGSAKF